MTMTRASLFALIAAAGLAAAPSTASADCHLTGGEGTAAADNGAPPLESAERASTEDELLEEGLDAPEDSAILPSAEGHRQSEAPTMEIDCTVHPELCSGDPLQTTTEGPALSEGADPGDPAGFNEPGQVVVAEPPC
jgi:hypothetical protein